MAKSRRSHGAKCVYCKKDHGDYAPWWREAKDAWVVTYRDDDGKQKQKTLAKGWDGHDEAIRVWRDNETASALTVASNADDMTVEQLAHLRLDFLKATTADGTYRTNKGWIDDFCYHPKHGFAKSTLSELKHGGVARVKKWANAHAWGDSTKSQAYKVVKAMLNFATGRSEDGLGVLETSPIAKLNTGNGRVRGRARVSIFSAEQEAAILANADPRGIYPQFGQAFRVLLATGCRPEEFCKVSAGDVKRDSDGQTYWWVEHKNQGKTGTRRRVYLTSEMQELTIRQAEAFPSGSIFRNNWGERWNVNTLYESLRRIVARPDCKKLGLDDFENGKVGVRLFVVYTCRHTFAHRHLTGFYKRPDGTPIILNYGEVAAMMGNSAAEVEKTYGKLVQATTRLSSLIDHG